MDPQHIKSSGYASMTVPKKSKLAGKKPPAPPPRKSSVPTVLSSSDNSMSEMPDYVFCN